MLATSGYGSGVKVATGLGRAAAAATLKRIATKGTSAFMKNALKEGAIKVANSVVVSAAKVPLMPMTYKTYTDKRTGQFSIGQAKKVDTGELETVINKAPQSAWRDAMHSGLETFMEIQSEDFGQMLDWDAQFGEDGIVATPIGDVKMGENQYLKMSRKGREGKLGMIKPTLESPDIIIEEKNSPADGASAERNSSFVFLKAFTNTDGTRVYKFASVTIRKDGREVVISNQEKETPRIKRLLKEGMLTYISDATLPSESTASTQGVQPTIPGGATLSESKDTTSEPNNQEIEKKNVVASEQAAEAPIPMVGRSLTDKEANAVISQMEANAAEAPEIELTPENWDAQFGEDGIVTTPIGEVKMGENQYKKLIQRKRSSYFGMILPTLQAPDFVLEELDPKEGEEQDTKLLFVKTFKKPNGGRYVHFESVTVKKEDREVSISSHEVNTEDLIKKMHNDKVVHLSDSFFDSEGRLIEPQAEGPDLVPTPNSSESKDTTSEPKNQEVEPKNVAATAIPTLKNGQPDYNAMPEEMFVEQYVAQFGEKNAENIARNNIKAADKAIADLGKKIGALTDPNKLPELKAKLDVELARKARYVAILDLLGLSENVQESNSDRVSRLKKENTPRIAQLFPDGLPNVESVILADIAGGHKMRWSDKVVNGAVVSRGLGAELGLADSNAERNRRVGLLSNDAPTPDEYAEHLRERLDAMGIRYEESELRDKVIDTYASVDTRGNAWKALESLAANQQTQEEALDYEEEQMRRAYEREQQTVQNAPDQRVDVFPEDAGQIGDEELSIEDETPFSVANGTVSADSSAAAQLATEAAIVALEDAGIEVVQATPEMAEEALRRNNVIWRKRKAPETGLPEDESSFKGPAISSAVGAKVIINLENLTREYEKITSARTFIGDIAQALEIPQNNKRSKYATFTTVSGDIISIRVSDHNATVSNFDKHGEKNGLSIVVSRGANDGIRNDGSAHLVEFFYSDKELNKADWKPLAQIIRSIQQALFSGVYEDTTGLAEIEEVNELFDIKAFHGSGAKFDAFDHTYMGTGEGAQAFGWGTYVSEVFGIGKRYAEARRRRNPYEYKLKNAETDYSLTAQNYKTSVEEMPERRQRVRELEAEYYKHTETLKELKSKFGEESPEYRNYLFYNDDWDDRIQSVRKSIAQGEEYLKHITQAFLDAAERLDEVRRLYESAQSDVYLYEVSIPEDNGNNYLYWVDVVPDEVVDSIQEKLAEEYNEDVAFAANLKHGQSGEQLYRKLERTLGSDRAASEYLLRSGYVGIKYPSQYMTGGRKDGASNYVIFDPSDTKIVHTTQFSIGPAPVFVSNAIRNDVNLRFQQQSAITYDNFFDRTEAIFIQTDRPNRPADYTSYKKGEGVFRLGKSGKIEGIISSEYWYGSDEGGDYIIRGSDHWTDVSGSVNRILDRRDYYYKDQQKPAWAARKYGYMGRRFISTCDWSIVVSNMPIDGSDGKLYGKVYLSDMSKRGVKTTDQLNNPRFHIAPTFYSNAANAVLGIKQEKAKPEQWLKMIEKAGGLKAGEDKWIGLSDWLKALEKKTLTKQEVLDYINENQIQIEETTYSSNSAVETTPEFKALQEEFNQLVKGYKDEAQRNLDEYEAYNAAWVDLVDRYGDDFKIAFWRGYDGIRVDNAEVAATLLGLPIDRPIYHLREDYTTKGLEGNREIALTVPTVESWNENDEVHFGDAGEGRAVAWVRFGETTDSDGKRVLVIDEVQSKRHQEGKEKGYIRPEDEELKSKQGAEIWAMMQKYNISRPADLRSVVSSEDATRLDELSSLKFGEVPDAPFEKNWAELAMKRMLRYAAENGFDKVAWTKGEQQAERYNIGSVVQRITSYEDGGSRMVIIRLQNNEPLNLKVDSEGKIVSSNREIGANTLADVVGKELSVKIMNNEGEDATYYDGRDIPAKVIAGDGLRIGGEGMKGFYDQILPSFMNKYGKKWGVKVQDVTLPYVEEAGRTMHSVDVTDSMRESVMQGQPMFYRRPNGVVYGWTNGKTVYLTSEGMNPNTPIHEYTHIWADAMMKNNPKGWASIVKLLKGTPVWNEVTADRNYANIHGEDNKIASEALSRISGRNNSAKMEAMAQQLLDEEGSDSVKKNRARKLLDRMRKALQEFWSWVGKELFGIEKFNGIDEVTDRVLYDLVSGTDLGAVPAEGVRMEQQAEERAEIERKAKENGTWLKAPNGADTNLTPEQWITVRTTAFKKWFGDWEKAARIEKLRSSEPIAIPENAYEGKYELNQASAEKYIKDNLRSEYRIDDTGEVVKLTNRSAKKLLSHSYNSKAHLQSIVAIPEMIQKAVFIDETTADKDNARFDSYRYYVCGVKIGGEDYTVRITIGVKDGAFYYDHSLTEIEKGNLIEIAQGFTPSGGRTLPSYAKSKDTRIIPLLQINSSKIVDENGEPKVVEHSTWNGDFYTFDINKLGESSGDNGIYGSGFYFGNVGETEIYGDRNIKAYLLEVNPFFLPEGDMIHFFDYLVENFDREGLRDIIVRNSAKSASMGEIIDAIKEIQLNHRNGEYDTLIEQMKEFWTPSSAEDMVIEQTIFRKIGFAFYRSLTPFIEKNIGQREFTESLRAAGYDGVIYNNQEYVAFNPNQIKSAEGNTTFDPRDDDIRFRVSPIDQSLLHADDIAFRIEDRQQTPDKRDNKIADLRAKLRNQKLETREVAQQISRAIRKSFTTDLVEKMGKRQFDGIIKLIETTDSRKDLERALARIEEVVLDIQLKNEADRFNKYLDLRVQGESSRGVSIAANVDDTTRQFITIIKENLNRPIQEVDALLNEQGGTLAERSGAQVLSYYQEYSCDLFYFYIKPQL